MARRLWSRKKLPKAEKVMRSKTNDRSKQSCRTQLFLCVALCHFSFSPPSMLSLRATSIYFLPVAILSVRNYPIINIYNTSDIFVSGTCINIYLSTGIRLFISICADMDVPLYFFLQVWSMEKLYNVNGHEEMDCHDEKIECQRAIDHFMLNPV